MTTATYKTLIWHPTRGKRYPYRVHPTKGLQYWSPFGAFWKPSVYRTAPLSGLPVVSYADTWAEPERDA